jgi:creatinine amidohydrolase
VTQILPTATETEEEARGARHAILPVGSFEQHGSYLPLITDTVIACAISSELVDAYGAFMLPPVTLSCSHEHSAWRGTVSISPRTLQSVIDDVYTSVTASGYRSLILVNAHGGNYILSNIVQEGSAHGRSIALFPAKDDWKEARRAGHLATTDHEDMHAGELETSILLHSHPELVGASYQSADWISDDRRHLLTAGMQKYAPNGVIGRPSLATAEKGKAVLDSLAESFAEVLQVLDSLMGND